MRIEFIPQRADGELSLFIADGKLRINGVAHDFSALPEGADVSPAGNAVRAKKEGGLLTVWVMLPHGADPTQDVAFPDPVETTSGQVPVPGHEALDTGEVSTITVPYSPPVALSQFERDVIKYKKRAEVKNQLIAEMAAENMARVRAGTWTVSDLTDLLNDPAKQVLDRMDSLSFELAAQLLAASTNPLLTPEIKAGWIAKLQAHYYTEP